MDREAVFWLIQVLPETVLAEPKDGLFCRSFGPVSESPGSFAVGPSPPRSMPTALLEKMELVRMRLPWASPIRPRPLRY